MTAASALFPRVSFAIDRGGTFTDVIAQVQLSTSEPPRIETLKLLSRDPAKYVDAPSEGIRRVLDRCGVPSTTDDGLIDKRHIDAIRMGTTVATNALLERNGARTVLVVTKGFRDVLEIGNQARPKIFELDIKKPNQLYEVVLEVDERVRVVGADELAQCASDSDFPPTWTRCSNGQVVDVLRTIDEVAVEAALRDVAKQGIASVAICFMHSYIFGDHELAVKRIAQRLGFVQCCASSELTSMVKYVPRTTTTSVDAAVTPLIAAYISGFRSRFADNLAGVDLLFIQSDGGLTDANTFFGYRAVLSGPAGGVVGCSLSTAHQLGANTHIVGFDMGGTSTDVCRCEGSRLEHVVEAEIGGALVLAPQVDVHTVAAGGGSILAWRNGMYHVGPASAGAFPGPACYGRGGPLTITDANLILGRIHPKHFPCVFGPTGDQPLNLRVTRQLFEDLAGSISRDLGRGVSVEEVASSFIDVSNEAMSRPIRNITEARGYRCSNHVLTVFGGAGGQHACAIAAKLGIRRIYANRFASFLSAVGISLSDIIEEAQVHCGWVLGTATIDQIDERISSLTNTVRALLEAKRFPAIEIDAFLHLRFDGTSTTVIVAKESGSTFEETFLRKYRQEFGFVLKNRQIVVDDIRVRGRGCSSARTQLLSQRPTLNAASDGLPPTPDDVVECYFDGRWNSTPVFNVTGTLPPLRGPLILIGDGTTLVVDPSSTATFASDGSVIIDTSVAQSQLTTAYDPLSLSIFAHRFMSIAEQMGYALQRTSISTNIKERLDFSCAIFDADGNLVANAPHIPVHLGAMGAAVLYQKHFWGADWVEGETVVSNHPACGGSHLPDITVMTPCWHDGKVAFYVASRGHHADIGGTTPGSMPPFSRSIAEEGAAIKAFKLVDKTGVFQEEGITEILMAPGKSEGMSGCRTLPDVLSDLKAQVAANHRGIELVKELIATYGAEVVHANMLYIQGAAERAVRDLLIAVAKKHGGHLVGEDVMDDGTAIAVDVEIDAATGSAVFDFTKTGDQVDGSTNCPTAVVKSALIYSMRCMVGHDIPLNQGCMAPLTVKTRPGSILAPDEDRAVVAGNVLTSQRITDVILSATRAAACSQGCMNNFTMGTDKLAYYETICGGAGAGPTFHGASAVQTHMTNTRITDPEILESRFPVLLRRFEIRRESGGRGRFNGGDGVRREFVFLRPMKVCILSERREVAPRGLEGGGDGAKGVNSLHRFDPQQSGDEIVHSAAVSAFTGAIAVRQWESLGGKSIVAVNIGDRILIETPGGGGYGTATCD